MGLDPEQSPVSKLNQATLPKTGALETVDDSNIVSRLAATKGVALVYFWGENCKPCEVYTPQVEEIAKEFSGSVKSFKFNAEKNLNYPEEVELRGLPTVILYLNGKRERTILGADKDRLRKELTDFASKK